MPWAIGDVERHIKGLSAHQKSVWVAVANSILAKTGDEGSAIQQANAAAKRASEVKEASEANIEARVGKGPF